MKGAVHLIKNKFNIPTFRTVFGKSVMAKFDLANLTPTQKLTLASSRIWGTAIGGNCKSGLNSIKNPYHPSERARYYQYAQPGMIYPYYFNHEKFLERHEKFRCRYMRIKMKGLKNKKTLQDPVLKLLEHYKKTGESLDSKGFDMKRKSASASK